MTTLMIWHRRYRERFHQIVRQRRTRRVTLSNAKPMALASDFPTQMGACPSYLRRATPLYRRCYGVKNQTFTRICVITAGVSSRCQLKTSKNGHSSTRNQSVNEFRVVSARCELPGPGSGPTRAASDGSVNEAGSPPPADGVCPCACTKIWGRARASSNLCAAADSSDRAVTCRFVRPASERLSFVF